ncbi:hypothetical protein HLB44_04265 [Aquincola sp. S2]|uniref:Uncharacterized protein n=1 Tax=Pseudaquabacterium terrae TaxID=2732868 RepID=A0ABX2EDG5_9BURK|nr:hypothetical protein [Aquabacterium terrae]NRF66190.1 hypothetical protein [Aquabacterium terrae]
MVKLLAALPLLVSFGSHAAIVGVAEMQDGASILFQDDRGPCVGAARLASFVKPAAAGTIPGCWVARGHHIAVVFFDGDVGAVPVAALKPPKNA